jgi:hypothetical protein
MASTADPRRQRGQQREAQLQAHLPQAVMLVMMMSRDISAFFHIIYSMTSAKLG